MNPTYAEVEQALLGRWPETRLEPSLDRIRAICDLLGSPQNAYPVIQLTGTNGKTSTARMIDTLVRALDLRTGRFTSPHLTSMTERISIDGEPLSEEAFVEAFADIAAYAQIVDDSQPHPLSFFEMTVAMAYAAFADAPIDVAIVEVGLGGTWDATSVADARIGVITPIAVDHDRYLGTTPEAIAVEKSGILKPGSHAVLAQQTPEVDDVIARRCAEVGAPVVRAGADFSVASRTMALGGQFLDLRGVAGQYDEVFLPLHGAHQAHNAAVALAAVETFIGAKQLDADVVREAFAQVTSPGRLEVVRRGPTVLLDAAHNPHGIEATVAAVSEEFAFSPLIGVVAIMADKDAEQILRGLEPIMAHIICTQNTSERCLPAGELAELADDVFGSDRISQVDRLDDAIERAITMAESADGYEDAIGSGAVLVTGSVVTVGEARTLLVAQRGRGA